MSNPEGFFEITVGNERREMNRENTKLYRHLGAMAMFDHLFVTFSEQSGAYMWTDHSQFDEVVQLATDAQCVMYLNLPEVSQVDVDAYVRHKTEDLAGLDTIPEDWT